MINVNINNALEPLLQARCGVQSKIDFSSNIWLNKITAFIGVHPAEKFDTKAMLFHFF
jgi:hypothetical protein